MEILYINSFRRGKGCLKKELEVEEGDIVTVPLNGSEPALFSEEWLEAAQLLVRGTLTTLMTPTTSCGY